MRSLLVVLLTVFTIPLSLSAQSAPHAISGTVVDATGGAVSGATVTLSAGGAERTAVTDSSGRFSFDQVPAGTASLTAIFDRFSPVTLDVTSAQTGIRIVLQPVPLTEDVLVTGALPNRIRTATRTETLLRDVPQSISVVSKETIAALNMTSLADVMRYVPGVGYAQGEGNRDNAMFRGNSSSSDFYVDGIRDDIEYYRDVYNLERVEVLKGPNAMIFGKGGIGGVINRVQRVANWTPTREASLQLGSYSNRRISTDLNQPLNSKLALRVSGMYENTDSYRSGVGLERSGINPTISAALGSRTVLRAGYEYFHDDRTADRGVPSSRGRPLHTDPSAFFGSADASFSKATVNSVFGQLEHRFNDRMSLRTRTSYADYDKIYQNVFPGAANSTTMTVSISAYNNAMKRQNLFSQTDLIVQHRTGQLDHTILAGFELGRQETSHFRNTGFFTSISPTTTTLTLPLSAPTTSLPIEFRQSATDADARGVTTTAALYAQDQVTLSRHVQAVVGLRFDDVNVDFDNHRTGAQFGTHDPKVSPRLGLIYKPTVPVSIYGSYSLSFFPRAGEQLSSLNVTNQVLEPEVFRNYELGLKWDVQPNSSFTAAVYHLARTNVVTPDPVDPTRSILIDAQRTIGVELGFEGHVTDRWNVLAAYAYQDPKFTKAAGTVRVGAMTGNTPKNYLSLWNRYQAARRVGLGLGLIYRGDTFTSPDNTVIMPAYFRADAAAFFTLNERFGAQVNIENLFGEEYYLFSNGNNNIQPGSPRALRVGLTTRF